MSPLTNLATPVGLTMSASILPPFPAAMPLWLLIAVTPFSCSMVEMDIVRIYYIYKRSAPPPVHVRRISSLENQSVRSAMVAFSSVYVNYELFTRLPCRKIPWRLSPTRKANQRKRLKRVDSVIEAVQASGVKCSALVCVYTHASTSLNEVV